MKTKTNRTKRTNGTAEVLAQMGRLEWLLLRKGMEAESLAEVVGWVDGYHALVMAGAMRRTAKLGPEQGKVEARLLARMERMTHPAEVRELARSHRLLLTAAAVKRTYRL